MADATFCAACPHSIRVHFESVTGEVMCMATGVTSAWGIPDIAHCDCVNYDSPETRRKTEKEQQERQRFADSVQRTLRAHDSEQDK